MNKIVYALPLLAATAVLAACTSSSSTSSGSTAVSTGRPATSAQMATEVITASTGNVDASSMTVKASGAFTDTGTLKLPVGNPRTITFTFSRGNLVVLNATGSPDGGPMQLNKTTCAFSQSSDGTHRILSGNSTGSYAGATGHGTYMFDSSGIAPKASGGTCHTTGSATPAKTSSPVSPRSVSTWPRARSGSPPNRCPATQRCAKPSKKPGTSSPARASGSACSPW